MRVVFSGVEGRRRLRYFWIRSFRLIFLVRPGLYCLTAPVGMCRLLLFIMVVVKFLVTVSTFVPGRVGESGWDRACSTLPVKAGQLARL